MNITTEVNINSKGVTSKIENLLDENTMLQIQNLFAKVIDPYVPMDTGSLAHTIEVTSKGVKYNVPYAHYMYIGLVYGPNIPIIENGEIVGWFSPPGKGSKYPTGRPINYDLSAHPLATSHWDQVAMQTQMTKFESDVKKILVRRAKELYG